MKLTTPEQKLTALADMDGWETIPEGHFHPDNPIGQHPPNYLASFDAIIPLIQKQSHKIQLTVRDLTGNVIICKHHYQQKPITPSELCDALLKAKGCEV